MRLSRMLALGASMLVLMSACSAGGGSSTQTVAGATSAAKPVVRIGSDGFYEAKLMAEIYGQALEAHGYTVDRTSIGLGTRTVTAAAIEVSEVIVDFAATCSSPGSESTCIHSLPLVHRQ